MPEALDVYWSFRSPYSYLLTPEDWRDSIETAWIGLIEIMRHYVPTMTEKGWGRIVNIATFSAKRPMVWRLMSVKTSLSMVVSTRPFFNCNPNS